MTYKLKYFNIQSMSVHDGDGLRSTVFLKGCPLRCIWCSNPESHSTEPCNGFGYKMDTAENIVKLLERDEQFFRRSGGGVTLSGGEPFFQGEGALELLTGCREMLWNTAVETCGYAEKEIFKKAVYVTDTFYFDIKVINPEKHKKLTGAGNELILSNLKMLYDSGCDLIIRYPVVPGINNSIKDMKELREWITLNCPEAGLEFLPYHKLGIPKYKQLGLEYALPHVEAPDKKYMEELSAEFNDAGIHCII